jgi:uncharacterized protein YfiM (DUF2279 family)
LLKDCELSPSVVAEISPAADCANNVFASLPGIAVGSGEFIDVSDTKLLFRISEGFFAFQLDSRCQATGLWIKAVAWDFSESM